MTVAAIPNIAASFNLSESELYQQAAEPHCLSTGGFQPASPTVAGECYEIVT
jgi:hypothetical protein